MKNILPIAPIEGAQIALTEKLPCTLEAQLFDLVEEYSLSEVLDRLSCLVHDQVGLRGTVHTMSLWGDLEKQLEQAVETSLRIKALDPGCSRWSEGEG